MTSPLLTTAVNLSPVKLISIYKTTRRRISENCEVIFIITAIKNKYLTSQT